MSWNINITQYAFMVRCIEKVMFYTGVYNSNLELVKLVDFL